MASGGDCGVEVNDSERVAGVAMSFPATDSSSPCSPSSKLPRRLRRRLLVESKSPSTAEEIDAKLKEAGLRRQRFHEALSTKARQKPRIPWSSSSQELELGRRIEAKLNAAEQKRLSILAKAQMRLSKMDELRRATRSEAEMRFERERNELGMKVESQILQAEANRLLIQKTNRQMLAARKERITQSLMRRMMQEKKYKERVRAAIQQKRFAAERKRMRFLEGERSKARARLLRVQRVANLVYAQREAERLKKKGLLEDRLQRAKRQREEYLMKRKSLSCSRDDSISTYDRDEVLAVRLARRWRRFVKSRGTTYELTKAFVSLNINEKSVKSMPFEQLALKIESFRTLKIVKSLLERLEARLIAQYAVGNGSRAQMENIDHLLKHVASPSRRRRSGLGSGTKLLKKGESSKERSQGSRKLSRYQERVLLCAYMILGHPDAVLSGKGEHENALADSAAKLVHGYELLIKIILKGKETATKSENSSIGSAVTFRSQLEEFDKAWSAYLYNFMVWKVKDAESLEHDLVRAACQLELSMMQTCKITPEQEQGGLTHGMKFIQRQVAEDQRLLKAKVCSLGGEAGIDRLESALSDTRSKYFASMDTGSLPAAPLTHILSPYSSGSENGSPVSISGKISKLAGNEWLGGVARSLFREEDPTSSKGMASSSSSASSLDSGLIPVTENELLVNEIVHENRHGFPNLDDSGRDQSSIKEKVKETMEKAFWDGVMDSVQREEPDFNWVLKLMTEVRDELCEMSPSSWKQDIVDAIDLDILSQVLQSENLDMNYLGRILEFALATLRKLSAPANEDDMRAAHQSLLTELAEVSQSENSSRSLLAQALIKGLRFVLQQIQVLKKEISGARIKLIEPLIRGPAGFDYLHKAFTNRYGPPSNAPTSLPLTMRWLSSVKPNSEAEWNEYMESLATLPSQASHPQGLPSALRTGGSASATSTMRSAITSFPGNERSECTGEPVDLLVRLGLLKLVSAIEGLTPESLPETLKLNLSRLRDVQNQLQKIVVIATSMLVLRQTLLSEKLVSTPSELETMVSECAERLTELLDSVEDVGVSEIISAIFKPSEDGSGFVADTDKLESVRRVTTNVLAKSLQSEDAIFTRVSHAIYVAMRALVLGGTGGRGRELTRLALRRIGAARLAEKVAEAAEVVVVVAAVSEHVHGAWYDRLAAEMLP